MPPSCAFPNIVAVTRHWAIIWPRMRAWVCFRILITADPDLGRPVASELHVVRATLSINDTVLLEVSPW